MISPHSCDYFQTQNLSSVYGIVLLQTFEAAADSTSAYGTDATGWGKSDAIEIDSPATVYSVASVLPSAIDAFSKLRTIPTSIF
jgi:hypothetical protein